VAVAQIKVPGPGTACYPAHTFTCRPNNELPGVRISAALKPDVRQDKNYW